MEVIRRPVVKNAPEKFDRVRSRRAKLAVEGAVQLGALVEVQPALESKRQREKKKDDGNLRRPELELGA